VPARGIEIEWLSIAGVRGRGLLAWLTAPFKIAWAVLQALAIMIRRRPGAVLGLGGFVAGPGGIAAWLMRRPLLIHEQNAVAGTTNRLLARLATRVFEAFPGSFPAAAGAVQIGNPVRPAIVASGDRRDRAAERADGSVHLLVLGGSQGALVLNETVPAAVAALAPESRPRIRHQAGRSLERALAAYRAAGVEADCVAFIDDMAAAYAWADLVVARAGALTLAELAAAGVGAVLVPFPHAIDDHQTANARYFAAAGAAVLLPQTELGPERLATELKTLFDDRRRIGEMAARSRSLLKADATAALAAACVALAGGAA
jgi:UDP-N-acetylglucosamine--N-acetylmuramyl-(pentapeptide) pyrophosphoryl-undecaprenol N-acetylglucosamine transferase